MENLTITKANALKAHQDGDAKIKLTLETLFPDLLKKTPIWDTIKTFEAALDLRHLAEEDVIHDEDTPDEAAYKKLKLLAEIWRGGWKPDWSNHQQSKYYPWFEVNKSGSGLSYDGCGYALSATRVGSRLCFPTSQLAEKFGKQFISLYEEFLLIK